MDDAPTYSGETDFYIILIVPIVFNSINLLGGFYIFYRTYLRWKFDCHKLSLSFKFPFYIAITDVYVSLNTVINSFYATAKGPVYIDGGIGVVTWPSPYCQIFGFFSAADILLNMFLVGAISVTTWIRVVQECYVRFGKFDYKIWVPAVVLSLIVPLIAVHSFGPQKYWCGSDGSTLITVLLLTTILLTLLTIIFCYVHVLRTIRKAKGDLSAVDSKNSSVNRSDIEKRCLKKVLTYIFVFILQYIPIMAFEICRYLGVKHILIFAMASSAISFGGIGNLIQYICNEGFKSPSNASISNSRLRGNEQQSSTNSISISVTDNMD